jgi:TolA-binding protein
MRYGFAGLTLGALLVAVPVSAQWADPYAGLRQLQASQALQAQQNQANALQEQVRLQQEQLEVQRQQLQLEIERQNQQLELQREQMLQQRQALKEPAQSQRNDGQLAAATQPTKHKVVPEGVYLNSEERLDDETKRCTFTNGLKREIPTTGDCWTW